MSDSFQGPLSAPSAPAALVPATIVTHAGLAPLDPSANMADAAFNPIHAVRMAIPRPQFFLVLLVGSVLVQFMIAGLRYQMSDKSFTPDDTTRVLPSSALLVTAHPDDEAMFFAPAIQALTAAGSVVSALCLSTGNAQGRGSQRAEELFASYSTLGLPAARVKYLDDVRLQDSMDAVWPNEHVAAVVAKHIEELEATRPVDALITFDKRGVSGHLNHIAAYNGTRDLAVQRNLPLYVLPSLEVWEKYNSVLFAVWETITYSGHPPLAPSGNKLPTHSSARYTPATEIHSLASPTQYINAVHAMLQHKSQLVWFRYLYLVFSRYMFSNTLVLWTPELDLDLDE